MEHGYGEHHQDSNDESFGDLDSLINDDEPSQQIDTAVDTQEEPEHVPARRGTTPLFSWDQVDSIVHFVSVYNRMSYDSKKTFLGVIGWDPKPENYAPLDLAKAVWPGGSFVASYRLFSKLGRKVSTGTLEFMDGVRLTGELSNLDEEVIRGFIRTTNIFTGDNFRYRRTMPIADVINRVMSTMISMKDLISLETVDSIDRLLSAWPGDPA